MHFQSQTSFKVSISIVPLIISSIYKIVQENIESSQYYDALLLKVYYDLDWRNLKIFYSSHQ